MSHSKGVMYRETGAQGKYPRVRQTPRVCVVSENIGLHLDEGVRNFARYLIQALGRRGPVLGISVGGPVSLPNVEGVKADKLFLSPHLRARVRAFAPDLLCYVPTASDTLFSFLRLRLLASASRQAATALVALQPRPHTPVGRWLQRWLAPDMLFVQSRKRGASLAYLGRSVGWLPSGVDLEHFRPVSHERKKALRAKYGLPQDAFLVLHVGHITRHRNVAMLTEVQRRWQVIMVTGNSVGEEPEVRHRLEQAGVVIFDQYLEAVEELYQAADCFLFPVHMANGSIEAPLSILEAMACNLPVVSTRFGGLEDMFLSQPDSGAGLLLADRPEELPGLVAQAEGVARVRTRDLVVPYSWDAVASRLVNDALEIVAKKLER